MERVLATEGEGEARFVGLLNALRDVYEENRIYLKPLVIDYHSSMFSRAYRQMLKDALKKDGNFPAYPENSREYIILDCVMSGYIEMLLQFLDSGALSILDCVMSGYIEMLLQFLDSGALSMEEAFLLAYYTMEHGTKPALLSQLRISDLSDQLQP